RFNRSIDSVKDFNFFMQIAIEKIIRYRIAFTVMQRALEQIRKTLSIPIEMEQGFVKLQKVLVGTGANLEQLRGEAFRLAATFGTAIKDIVEIMTIWGQQGKSQNEINKLTEATLLGMAAAGLEAKEAVELLTSAQNI